MYARHDKSDECDKSVEWGDVLQHYAQQQQQQQQLHSSYAAPSNYVRPAPMAAPAYAAQPAAYAAAPMYPPQQQAGYGEWLCSYTFRPP